MCDWSADVCFPDLTPPAGTLGNVVINYQVFDGASFKQGTLTVLVNNPPVLAPSTTSLSAPYGTASTLHVPAASDLNTPQTLTYTFISSALGVSASTINMQSNGTFSYTPPASFTSDTITYRD